MNWHYLNLGQAAGPVSEEQFAELVRAGQITPETLVWREGMADWLPLRQAGWQPPAAAAAAPSAAPDPAPVGLKLASPAAGGGQAATAACTECGKMLPLDETVQFGGSRVCAACKPLFMQKLSEGAAIAGGSLRYAGVGMRFLAILVDGIILGIVNLFFLFISSLLQGGPGNLENEVAPGLMMTQVFLMVLQLGIAVSYEVFFIGKYGATPGKMACKIKVVTADGGRVSYLRALGRFFSKLLSYFICAIGYIMAIFDDEKRALHDRICNTRVVQL